MDAGVLKLLRVLGLERYAERFASEEIDMAALRLLNEHDFAQLRIPDAARRRIAEALQSVQILAQIEGSGGETNQIGREEGEENRETDVVQTQRFAPSRLRKERGRKSALAEESEDDEEFDFRSFSQKQGEVANRGLNDVQRNNGEADALGSDTDDLENRVVTEGCSPGCAREQAKGEAVRTDHSLLSSVAEETEGSSLSSLQDIERGMMSTSQISLETKLEKWLRRQMLKEKGKHRREVERERERHKTEMEGIQRRYGRMRKRICSSRDLASDKQPISRVTEEEAPSTSDLPISCSLGEGDSVASEETGSLPEAKQCPPASDASGSALLLSPPPLERSGSRRSISPIAGGAACRGTHSPLEQGPFSPAVDLTQNSSEEEHRVRQTPTENFKPFPNLKLVDTIVISSTRPPTKPSLEDDVPFNNPEEVSLPFQSDQFSVNSPAQPKPASRPQYKSLFMSSDEEVMDLTFPNEENVKRNEDEANGSSSRLGNTDESEKDVRERNEGNGGETRAREASQATLQPPSRLKKRARRVTPADVIAAIRQNKDLYDDILMMESIPFERILESVKASGIKIAKKALTELLQREGVSFRLEEVNEKQKTVAGSYFQRLNCNSD